MKIVLFLQNAWSPLYAGDIWPRQSWLKALDRSRSGQRLKVLTKDLERDKIWFDNTTPIVGATPDSVIKPDFDHIKAVLKEQEPNVVVSLGKQAEKCLDQVCVLPLLMLPHPACRIVTNELYRKANEILHKGFTGTVKLAQGKHCIFYATTPPC